MKSIKNIIFLMFIIVEKEGCMGKKGQYEWLYSGQSLCVTTKEGQIAAIGGTWQETENTDLKWKLFS